MKMLIPVLAVAALLAGCATTPQSLHSDAGKALAGAATALDFAEKQALIAVQAGWTTKAQDQQLAALTAPCPASVPLTLEVAKTSCPVKGGLALAKMAYAASDQSSWPALLAVLTGLTAQITGMLHS